MAKIWANRLIAGDQVWARVPKFRRNAVKAELAKRVENGEITGSDYESIVGEPYTTD